MKDNSVCIKCGHNNFFDGNCTAWTRTFPLSTCACECVFLDSMKEENPQPTNITADKDSLVEADASAFINAAMSPSGALWRKWFERVGEAATVHVVNATANLVIGERNIYHSRTSEQQWQAIETAPKDGTWQAVARLDVNGNMVWWHRAKFTKSGVWRTDGGTCEPTHWMRLSLPQKSEEE